MAAAPVRARGLGVGIAVLGLVLSSQPQVAAVSINAAGTSFIAAAKYSNCAKLNAVCRHGVGKPGAHARVSGSTTPVTNFTRNLAVYNSNNGSRPRQGRHRLRKALSGA